jgi:VWFA-related protein
MRWTNCWKSRARRDSFIKRIVCFLWFFLGAAVLVASQEPVQQESQTEPNQQEPTFRSQTNLVLVPALVRDAAGHAVYGLQAKDFILEDNGVPQTVHLDDDTEGEPLSIVVAVQTGRSASREFSRIRGLNSMLGPILEEPQTEIAIVQFDSQVSLAQNFTDDSGKIQRTLQGIKEGDGGAAILDAVRYATQLLSKIPGQRQRVLLLVSETRDHGSQGTKIDDLVALIGNSNISVYALAFSPGLGDVIDPYRGDSSHQGPEYIAALFLARAAMKRNTPKAIAAQTGGEYETFDTLNGFENHMMDFTNHLHSRYLLSFHAKDPEPGLHRITVRLAQPDGNTILARSSYWAGGAAGVEGSEGPGSPFAGVWQSRVSPIAGKPSVTINISVSEGVAGGLVTLVNADGTEIRAPIVNAVIYGERLVFGSTFENGTTYSWRMSLKKNGEEATLHGSVGEVVVEEAVFKQP